MFWRPHVRDHTPWRHGATQYSYWRIECVDNVWVGQDKSGRIKPLQTDVGWHLKHSGNRQGALFQDEAAIRAFLEADGVPANIQRYVAGLRQLRRQAYVITRAEMREIFGRRSPAQLLTSFKDKGRLAARTLPRNYSILLDGPAISNNFWRVFSAETPTAENLWWAAYLESFTDLFEHRPELMDTAETFAVESRWRGRTVTLDWPLGPVTSMGPSFIATVPGTNRTALLWLDTKSRPYGQEVYWVQGRPAWFTGKTTVMRFVAPNPPNKRRAFNTDHRPMLNRSLPLDVLAACG